MYKFIKSHNTGEIVSIQRLSDMAYIPIEESNSEYKEYLKWTKNGNKTLEPDPVVVADTQTIISAPFWKIKVILNNKNWLDKAQAFVDASDDFVLKTFWEKGDVVTRDSPKFALITDSLKIKPASVDKLFDDANNLKV